MTVFMTQKAQVYKQVVSKFCTRATFYVAKLSNRSLCLLGKRKKKKRVGDTTQQFCTEHLVGSWLDIDLFVWLWVLVSIVI